MVVILGGKVRSGVRIFYNMHSLLQEADKKPSRDKQKQSPRQSVETSASVIGGDAGELQGGGQGCDLGFRARQVHSS